MVVSLFQSFFTDEDTNLMKKFKLYLEDNWNKCDMVTIFLFIIGVTCRYIHLFYVMWSASGAWAAYASWQESLTCVWGQGMIFTNFEKSFCNKSLYISVEDVAAETTKDILLFSNTCTEKLSFSFFLHLPLVTLITFLLCLFCFNVSFQLRQRSWCLCIYGLLLTNVQMLHYIFLTAVMTDICNHNPEALAFS